MERNSKKTIGFIPYSLTRRSTNPSDKDSEKKVFPIAQRGETVNLVQLSAHIHEHGSPFSEGTIHGILVDMVDCIKEQMLLGNFVLLDGLARFFYTLSAEGIDDPEKFDASMIKQVNIRCSVDAEFQNTLNNKAKFVYTASRKEQAQARKAEKEALSDALNGDNTGGGNSGGSGSGDVTE